MKDFIERLQAKPEHIRQRIAFFSSAGITAVVAVGWFGAVASSGAFSLAPTTPGGGGFGNDNQVGALVQETSSGFEDLLGAVGEAGGVSGASTNPSGLITVDGQASSTLDRDSNIEERTVIPF